MEPIARSFRSPTPRRMPAALLLVTALSLAACGQSTSGDDDASLSAVDTGTAAHDVATVTDDTLDVVDAAPADDAAAMDAAPVDAPADVPAYDVLTVGGTARVTSPDFLNLRSSADMSGSVLAEMPCGATVTLVGAPMGIWWNVRFGTQTGWASATYLTPSSLFDPSVCPSTLPTTCTVEDLDVPASLVSTLSVTPYVEQNCTATTFAGWPYAAQHCTYSGGVQVTVADPSATRVARWIVDSAALIPALAGLRTRDRTSYEAGLRVIAVNVLDQSSRIFPLAGQVREDTTNFVFDRGVTATCSSGCYCRINSISRPDWCHYTSTVLHSGSESACLSDYSTTRFTDAWAAQCLSNEIAAWNCDINQHFRARAWVANEHISSRFPSPSTASGAAVVSALRGEFPP